jgi:hypothetical protein
VSTRLTQEATSFRTGRITQEPGPEIGSASSRELHSDGDQALPEENGGGPQRAVRRHEPIDGPGWSPTCGNSRRRPAATRQPPRPKDVHTTVGTESVVAANGFNSFVECTSIAGVGGVRDALGSTNPRNDRNGKRSRRRRTAVDTRRRDFGERDPTFRLWAVMKSRWEVQEPTIGDRARARCVEVRGREVGPCVRDLLTCPCRDVRSGARCPWV